MANTPNMDIELPVPGPGGTAGPGWASDINEAITTIDEHDHTDGRGVPIRSAALEIDDEVDFDDNGVTGIHHITFQNQASQLVGASYPVSLWTSGSELYWTTAAGAAVRFTNGTSLNFGTVGGINGDYSTSSSSLSYSDTTKRFTFTQSTGKMAKVETGDIRLYPIVQDQVDSIGLLSPTLAASYDLTLFPSLPAVTRPVSVTSTGQLTCSMDLSVNTITGTIGMLLSGRAQVTDVTGSGGANFAAVSGGVGLFGSLTASAASATSVTASVGYFTTLGHGNKTLWIDAAAMTNGTGSVWTRSSVSGNVMHWEAPNTAASDHLTIPIPLTHGDKIISASLYMSQDSVQYGRLQLALIDQTLDFSTSTNWGTTLSSGSGNYTVTASLAGNITLSSGHRLAFVLKAQDRSPAGNAIARVFGMELLYKRNG